MLIAAQYWNLDWCKCGHERADHADDPMYKECESCPLAFISKRGHSPSKCTAFRPRVVEVAC